MKHSFYGRLRAQGYDIGTDVSEIMRFYVAQWDRLGRPQPMIELMCGTGLNMVWFLREGAVCDGLDASSHMLHECQKRLSQNGFFSALHEQDLASMNLPRTYQFMFIPGGSFGHVYDKSIALESLKRMHEQLAPGGWLVLDVRPPAYMSHFGKHDETDHMLDDYEDGSTVFTTGVWQHLEAGRIIRKWNKMEQFVNDVLQETEVFDYRERLYDEAELREMLVSAGFDAVQTTKAYEFDAVPAGADGIVFACQKRSV